MRDRTTVFAHGHDPISHAGVVAQLRGRPEVEIVESLSESAEADVGLLSVDKVDDDAVRAIKSMRRNGCGSVVVVANVVDDASVLRAVEEGAVGIVRRTDASPELLSNAVENARAGGGELPRDLLGSLLRQVQQVHESVLVPQGLAFSSLSDREMSVLRLVSDGLDTKQIATTLCYSERTIKNVVQDVMRRFGLKNRCHAVSFAIRQGLI
jgi:DNA-binding NarL/FixJ family response regulator